MNRFALAFCIALLGSRAAGSTSDLVDASKEAKEKRKASTTKVITNKDVKKAKGKLIERPATPAPAVKHEPSLVEKGETDRAARLAAEERLKTAQARVDRLQRDLDKLEQSYFEANDLDHRDNVIAKEFAVTKAKLDEAKKELAAVLPPS